MARYDVQERIDLFTVRAENQVAGEMISDFNRELKKQFKKRKDVIEDWQDVTTQKANLMNRLRTVADRNSWTEDNVLDMALISAILWNDIVNGD